MQLLRNAPVYFVNVCPCQYYLLPSESHSKMPQLCKQIHTTQTHPPSLSFTRDYLLFLLLRKLFIFTFHSFPFYSPYVAFCKVISGAQEGVKSCLVVLWFYDSNSSSHAKHVIRVHIMMSSPFPSWHFYYARWRRPIWNELMLHTYVPRFPLLAMNLYIVVSKLQTHMCIIVYAIVFKTQITNFLLERKPKRVIIIACFPIYRCCA